MMKEWFDAVAIALEADGQLVLFILLVEDGTVNRMGTGAIDSKERETYVGVSEDGLFEKFMDTVPDEIFKSAGTYRHPESLGLPCKLTIGFRSPRRTIGFEFQFGSQSEGPPQEISQLVKTAIDLTKPWYQQNRQASELTASKTVDTSTTKQ